MEHFKRPSAFACDGIVARCSLVYSISFRQKADASRGATGGVRASALGAKYSVSVYAQPNSRAVWRSIQLQLRTAVCSLQVHVEVSLPCMNIKAVLCPILCSFTFFGCLDCFWEVQSCILRVTVSLYMYSDTPVSTVTDRETREQNSCGSWPSRVTDLSGSIQATLRVEAPPSARPGPRRALAQSRSSAHKYLYHQGPLWRRCLPPGFCSRRFLLATRLSRLVVGAGGLRHVQ